jgi:multisubunit Na+/H+ antiporter MnhG subunit
VKLPDALVRPNEMTRTVVSYTALRLGLFAIVFLLLLFTPFPTIVDLAIALVASAVVSYPIGRHQRDRMVVLMEERRIRKERNRLRD